MTDTKCPGSARICVAKRPTSMFVLHDQHALAAAQWKGFVLKTCSLDPEPAEARPPAGRA